MIEITGGSLEEQIIKLIQKTYPISVEDLQKNLHLSRDKILRTLNQLQVQGIVQLEPLPNKTYIRLLRHDFKFVSKKRQRKFIKHHHKKREYIPPDEDDIMYG